MHWIQVKAEFKSSNQDLAEELVSDIFFTQGLKGVVCQVPLPEPEEGFGSDALPIPRETSISGYLPDTEISKETLSVIQGKLAGLSAQGIRVTITTRIVDQEDWAESWKEFFHVTRITDRIVIRPTWREFKPQPGDLVIDLDPGMAFGTGTHPTTAMCLALLEKYLSPGDLFLDVGTGSGILMIAAHKLGAALITGIDNDETAIRVTLGNLADNRIDPAAVHTACTTLECLPDKKQDLITANIIAEVILEIIPDIRRRLRKNGTAVLSGIIQERHPAILAELAKEDLSVIETRTQGEWVALAVQKKRNRP